jgi:hypothetical protein
MAQYPGDLVGLATLLEHSSLDTTQLYSEPSASQLATRVERLNINAYHHKSTNLMCGGGGKRVQPDSSLTYFTEVSRLITFLNSYQIANILACPQILKK